MSIMPQLTIMFVFTLPYVLPFLFHPNVQAVVDPIQTLPYIGCISMYHHQMKLPPMLVENWNHILLQI